MKRFIDQFGHDCIACVLGDREFIGKDWLKWLNEHSISFVIRVRSNQLTTNSKGMEIEASALFHDVKIHQVKNIRQKRRFSGIDVYLSGTKDKTGELLIVISNNDDIDQLIPIYSMRWEIENLFQPLKGRGFNFEDTHLTDPEKICKLMALLAIGVVWAHKVGQ